MDIVIVGSGNVATHLNRALQNKAAVSLVNPRKPDGFTLSPQLVIICVADDAISEVAANLPVTSAVLSHTSGSVPLDVLAPFAKDYGVFYPLQTFSKNIDLDYSQIPVFIEASSNHAKLILNETAAMFTDDIREADSKSRRQLHLASVFACNFTNALIAIGADLLQESGIEFSALRPLLRQTIDKLDILSPSEAQTGPALRGDRRVMESHMALLSDKPDLAEIYKMLSNQIKKYE